MFKRNKILHKLYITFFFITLVTSLSLFVNNSLFALPNLSIEDEIIMSKMVRNSTSVKELNLFLKLFPNSPYSSRLEQRLFRLEMQSLSPLERKNFDLNTNTLTWGFNTPLTLEDEITLNRLVRISNTQKQIRLFIKVFPNSPFRDGFEKQMKTTDPETGIIEDDDSYEEIEEVMIAQSKKEKKAPPPRTNKEVEKKITEEPDSPGDSEKKEPEEDWAKYEIGSPSKVKITDSDNNEITTDGAAQGLLIGWSTEVWLDIGGGGALEYFTQKLGDNGGELQHLFLETQIRGRIFNLLNWGVGYGKGMTTIKLENQADDTEIIPGEGIIQSISLGVTWSSFGINYVTGNFTGSYQLAQTSGNSVTTTTTKWKGTLNMITLEYIF